MGFPIKNDDFPWQNVSSPEGKHPNTSAPSVDIFHVDGYDRNRPQSHGWKPPRMQETSAIWGQNPIKCCMVIKDCLENPPKVRCFFSQITKTSVSHISWLYSRDIPMIPYIATMSPSSQRQLRKRKLCVALASISGRGCDAWQWKCMAAMRCGSSRSGSAGFGDQTRDDCSICSANLEAKTPRKPQKKRRAMCQKSHWFLSSSLRCSCSDAFFCVFFFGNGGLDDTSHGAIWICQRSWFRSTSREISGTAHRSWFQSLGRKKKTASAGREQLSKSSDVKNLSIAWWNAWCLTWPWRILMQFFVDGVDIFESSSPHQIHQR